MRIGVAWVPNSNANYRAIDPMKAMIRRGHEVVWPATGDGAADASRLASCDVVHVYRRADDETRRVLAHLARAGVAITFDTEGEPGLQEVWWLDGPASLGDVREGGPNGQPVHDDERVAGG
jgi:hypothetical protein